MTFTDKQQSADKHSTRPLRIEIGRTSWRDGISVELCTPTNVHVVREIITSAFDLAGRNLHTPSDVAHPGWWAIMVGFAASHFGPTSIAKIPERSPSRHAVMLVGDLRIGEAPDWPLTRFAPTSPWYDLRTESCLRHGPSITEIEMYRATLERPLSRGDILRQFEIGVLEWIPGEPKNRLRGIRAAGS